MHSVTRDVHHRLYDGTLGGQHDDLVIYIVEGGTDPPGVSHRIALPTTRLSAHHEATIPEGGTLTQDVGQIHTLLDVVGDIHPLQAVSLALDEEALDLPIQPMPDLLQ